MQKLLKLIKAVEMLWAFQKSENNANLCTKTNSQSSGVMQKPFKMNLGAGQIISTGKILN